MEEPDEDEDDDPEVDEYVPEVDDVPRSIATSVVLGPPSVDVVPPGLVAVAPGFAVVGFVAVALADAGVTVQRPMQNMNRVNSVITTDSTPKQTLSRPTSSQSEHSRVTITTSAS